MEGISNETIVDFFENETDNDLKKKTLSMFFCPTTTNFHPTRFISFHEMMIEKNCYPFIVMIWIEAIETVHTGGVFSIYIQEKRFFYLTVLGFRDLKNSSTKTIEKLLTKFYLESKNFKRKISRSRWSP